MTNYIYNGGYLENGLRYDLLGRGHNGTSEKLTDNIFKVGQDVALVLPEYNILGVFDGAGGAVDIGSPELAAYVAADAINSYYNNRSDATLAEAMAYADNTIQLDSRAGICVGGLVQVSKNRKMLKAINVGDTSIARYDSKNNLALIVDQQSNSFEPTNYLGAFREGRLPLKILPAEAEYIFDVAPHEEDEVYVMSDGCFGDWRRGNAMEEYHFSAAHNDYQLLRDAINSVEGIEELIRRHLYSDDATELRRKLRNEAGNIGVSFSLDDPSLFRIDRLDWMIWEHAVKPYIDKIPIKRSRINANSLLKSLIEKPIAWEHERPPMDDATVIRVVVPNY